MKTHSSESILYYFSPKVHKFCMFITHQTTFNNSLILHTQSRYVVNTDVALSPFRKRSITFASQMNRFHSLISSETGGVHHSYPLQHCVVQTEMSCLPTQTLKKNIKQRNLTEMCFLAVIVLAASTCFSNCISFLTFQ